MKKDMRFVSGTLLSVRGAQGEEDAFTIQGRAVGYGCLSLPGVPGPGCRERILQGAFRDSLASGQPVTCDFNHSNEFLTLGTTKNKSLTLTDKNDGLHFQVRLNPRVQAHRDLHNLVKDGTLSECSFAFGDAEDEWSNEFDDTERSYYTLRSIKRARLYSVSIVASPAYGSGATNVSARSLRYALGGSSKQGAWSPTLRARVAAIGKQLEYDQTLLAVEESRQFGFKEIRVGPNEADLMFRPMTADEYDEHLRHRAALIGAEIHKHDDLRERAREVIAEGRRLLEER